MRRKNELSVKEISKVSGIVPASNFSLDELFELFARDCEIKNLRPATIKYYHNEIHAYAKFLREQSIDPHPSKVTTEQIENNLILYSEKVKKLRIVTINSRIRALKSFFHFLKSKKYLSNDPMDGIKQLKHRERIIPTFSSQQLARLFNTPNLRTFTGVRDLTIMMLMFDIAIRVNELVNIDIYDVNLSDSMINVRKTKGYRERALPMCADMREQLRKYIAIRGDVGSDALFVTVDGGRLSKRQVQNAIAKYGHKAKVSGVRCSPHTFRHTSAKMSVQNGANIFDLQYMLGHSSLEMAKVYVHMFGNDVKKTHSKFSPLKNLRRLK